MKIIGLKIIVLGDNNMSEDVEDFLKELIKAKSLSGEEDEVAGLIKNEMKDLGYDEVFEDEYGNIVGRIGDGKPEVMFEGHMDTVGEGSSEWDHEPFSGIEEDGKIHGRGSVDMKGSIASMIYAGFEAKEQIKKLGGSLYVTTVVHEETAEGAAIKNVIENHVRPDYVIIGEPSNLDICIGHRGRAVIEVNTEGRSSHASMPELGKNAAYELIDVINKLKELELDQDDFLGKESMALVHISCEPGSGPVVPDKAKAVLDFRIIQETTEKTLLNKIDKVMNELNVEGKSEIVTGELESYNGEKIEAKYFFPAWKTKNDEFISSVKKALKFVDDTEIRSWTFSTDGVYTAGKAKIPTIGFGPGNEELAHQPNEHTETNEIEIAVQGYKSILKELMR